MWKQRKDIESTHLSVNSELNTSWRVDQKTKWLHLSISELTRDDLTCYHKNRLKMLTCRQKTFWPSQLYHGENNLSTEQSGMKIKTENQRVHTSEYKTNWKNCFYSNGCSNECLVKHAKYKGFVKEGWALKPHTGNESIKLGPTNGWKIDQAQKIVFVMSSPCWLFTYIVVASRQLPCKPDMFTFS